VGIKEGKERQRGRKEGRREENGELHTL